MALVHQKQDARTVVFSSGKGLLKNDGGATAIEYAFIAAMIVVAIVAVVVIIGSDLRDAYQNVADLF